MYFNTNLAQLWLEITSAWKWIWALLAVWEVKCFSRQHPICFREAPPLVSCSPNSGFKSFLHCSLGTKEGNKTLLFAPVLCFWHVFSGHWSLALPSTPPSLLGLCILTDLSAVFNILKIIITGSLFFSFAYPLITVLTGLCLGTERSGSVFSLLFLLMDKGHSLHFSIEEDHDNSKSLLKPWLNW